MTNKGLVYKLISKDIKGRVELLADPIAYYGSDEVGANYTLRLHKFNLGKAFIHKIEFKGKNEQEVFDDAYEFIQDREAK